ncbi:phosphotransferase [Streptacidiphilus sp. EB129]|uniref:maltokinase N-terminal cap-like domain-containing protein n=1 Tax=Streptacidiphilus sp. EB129 TaxID=3156262 RepID=UPI0035113BA3
MPVALCESCLTAQEAPALQADHLLRPLLPAVLPWLITRRWFTHDDGCLDELQPLGAAVLVQNSSMVLVHSLLTAHRATAPTRTYQLLLGLRRSLPAHLDHAVIGQAGAGPWDGWWIYEATEDPELMSGLLRTVTAREQYPGVPVRFTGTGDAPIPLDRTPRALSVERSNSTVVFGDRFLIKFFRRPESGAHPEVEVLRALTTAGCPRTPGLTGWLHTPGAARRAFVLGIVEDFYPRSTDAWELAVRQATDCINGDSPALPAAGGFTAQARALGAAVAEVHTALAESFPRTWLSPERALAEAEAMSRRLQEAVHSVPRLKVYADGLAGLYDDYARVAAQGRGLPGQRIHGDLHLGQVLWTADGWKIIDFEGEPARPVAERSLPQLALRDVAGMLRSFDYAAQQALSGVRAAVRDAPRRPARGAGNSDAVGARDEAQGIPARLRQSRRAQAWAVRNRRAFSLGYAEAGGADPLCHPVQLRAFEADKAVDEAVHEAQHRPGWLHIPMTAVERLAHGH